MSCVEAWSLEKGSRILAQLEGLGASLDWSSTQFTLSKEFRRAVDSAFIRLWEQGLVYRGQRLVNWCPALHSAISDIEVEHLEIEGVTDFEVFNASFLQQKSFGATFHNDFGPDFCLWL